MRRRPLFSTTPAVLQEEVSSDGVGEGRNSKGIFTWDNVCPTLVTTPVRDTQRIGLLSAVQQRGWSLWKRRRLIRHANLDASGSDPEDYRIPDTHSDSDNHMVSDVEGNLSSGVLDRLSLLFPQPQLPATIFNDTCNDHAGIVPMITLGYVYCIMKQGARIDEVPESIPPVWNKRKGANVWEAGSMLYGKLVMWVSRDAARKARRREGHPSLRNQQKHSAFATKRRQAADGVSNSTDSDSQEDDENALHMGVIPKTLTRAMEMTISICNLATQQRLGWAVIYEAPPIKHARKFRLPWTMQTRKGDDHDAEGDAPAVDLRIPWLEAVGAELWLLPGLAPSLLQLPLPHAVALIERSHIGYLPPSFTLGPSPDEVIPRNKWPLLGGPKLQKGAQVPMFSIPGVWAILPSAKGFVKFSPYFLSKEQLCDCWDLLLTGRAMHVREERQRVREERLGRFKKAVIKWADSVSGTTIEPPQDSGGEATGMEMVSENEPSELKAILQTLGFSSEEKPKAKRELKGPLAMLPITACGSLLTAAHLIYLARNQLEEFLRLLGSVVRIRPVVVSRPLVDVVAEIKRHNASTLAKIYPVSSSSKASDSDATSGDELEVGEPEIDPFKDNEAKRVEKSKEVEIVAEGEVANKQSPVESNQALEESDLTLEISKEAFEKSIKLFEDVSGAKDVTISAIQERARQTLRDGREMAEFTDLFSKGSGRGEKRWQNIGSGRCPLDQSHDCFLRVLAVGASEFFGWGLWQLINTGTAYERASLYGKKWRQVGGRSQWVIQVPGDYLEDEDRHCEEGEQCNSSVYGIASFDKDQADGRKAPTNKEAHEDILKGMFLIGDLQRHPDGHLLTTPLDLGILNAPNLDKALNPWP